MEEEETGRLLRGNKKWILFLRYGAS